MFIKTEKLSGMEFKENKLIILYIVIIEMFINTEKLPAMDFPVAESQKHQLHLVLQPFFVPLKLSPSQLL